MLRPGLALYGYLDRLTLDGLSWEGEPGFAPVLAWKTQVTSLRTLQAGETVGYGNTFVADPGDAARAAAGWLCGRVQSLAFEPRACARPRPTRRPLPGGSRWTRRWWMLRRFPGCAIGDEVVLLGSQGAPFDRRLGSGGSCRTPYPGRCCAQLARGFHG